MSLFPHLEPRAPPLGGQTKKLITNNPQSIPFRGIPGRGKLVSLGVRLEWTDLRALDWFRHIVVVSVSVQKGDGADLVRHLEQNNAMVPVFFSRIEELQHFQVHVEESCDGPGSIFFELVELNYPPRPGAARR
jgi:hypothetical protein